MKIYNASIARKYKLPLVIILVGILFTLYLQLQIPDEIFFSGDAGPKVLLTKQFASGKFQVDLDLPAESWVLNLWASGLYPFDPPFAYNINNRYYIQYHFIFPLISAPFYALFGWRGLYIIPLTSIWIIWWRFYVVCLRLRLGITSISLGLATVIFASPLTLYSAMYWEHAIAVCLAFYGLSIILIPPAQELTKSQAILSGILIGLSVWFRQELLFLIVTICLLFYASSKLNLIFKQKQIIIVSMLLTVALFLGINQIAYHHPLGIYSIPLGINSLPAGKEINESGTIKELSDSGTINVFWACERIARYFIVFVNLNKRLFVFFPITIFPILYILRFIIKNKKIKPNIKFLFLIWLANIFAVALVGWEGGKEWGARYLLILIPLISLIAIMTLNSLIKIRTSSLRSTIITIFLLLFAGGLYINTYLGTIRLSRDYKQRVLPALKFLQTKRNPIVAVAHEFISQELEAAFSEKVFFLTKNNDELRRLGSVLLGQGYEEFLYLVPYERQENYLEFSSGDKLFAIKLSKIGKFGIYHLYEASMIETSGITESKR